MNEEWKTGTLLKLIAFTDPYCTWCWGSEPILRRIQEVYGDQIEIQFIMGGLVKDVSTFHDHSNSIGGEQMMENIAEHWNDASHRHGMPVASEIWLKDNGFTSTYPANIAYKAAEISDPPLVQKYLRRLREAAAAEGRFIHQTEVQSEIAQECGLNLEKFKAAITTGEAEKAFNKDLDFMRSLAVTGFPTFFIAPPQGVGVYLHGFQSFYSFEKNFEQLAPNSLTKQVIIPNEDNFIAFIAKYEKVATKEIAEVFTIPLDEAYEKLLRLVSENKISRTIVGNGEFWQS